MPDNCLVTREMCIEYSQKGLLTLIPALNHWGLPTPYYVMERGQHCFGWWLSLLGVKPLLKPNQYLLIIIYTLGNNIQCNLTLNTTCLSKCWLHNAFLHCDERWGRLFTWSLIAVFANVNIYIYIFIYIYTSGWICDKFFVGLGISVFNIP